MTQLFIIIAYLGLLLLLGLGANRLFRGDSRDYMLASQTIGPVLLLMSLFGTTMTAFALVGSTGKAYTLGVGVYGMLASASGVVHSLCFFIIGVRLWSLGKRHGYTTQIQFFRDRLESSTLGLLLFPVLVALVIPYLLIGVVGAGPVINEVTQGAFRDYGWFAGADYGVPRWLASLVVCLVVLTYVFFGGMRGTAWANTFQTAVFMTLGVITFVAIANGVGGKPGLWQSIQSASASLTADKATRSALPRAVYFSFLLIPLSVAMFPHVFQHWLTARSASSFKLPIVAHPIFIMIVWLPCVLIGAWASARVCSSRACPKTACWPRWCNSIPARCWADSSRRESWPPSCRRSIASFSAWEPCSPKTLCCTTAGRNASANGARCCSPAGLSWPSSR